MKRFFSILLALLMLLPAGCGGSDTPAPSEAPSQGTEESGAVLSIQDPQAFLHGSALGETKPSSTGVQKLTFTLEPEEDVLALQYADLLLSGAYHLEQLDRVESESDTAKAYACYFRYTGEGELPLLDMQGASCHLFIGIRRDNGESTTFTLIYPDGVTFADWGARADRSVIPPEPVPSPSPSPAPSPTPDPQPVPTPSGAPAPTGPSVIPDFLANDPSGAFRAGTSSYDHAVCFLADDNTYFYAAEAYVQLLLDQGYRITKTDEVTKRTYSRYQWNLYHDGLDCNTIEDDTHVRVKHLAKNRDGEKKTEISIGYAIGITYGGDEQYQGGGGGSSSGGGSWDPNLPDHSKLQCLTCDGSGDCPSCSGYGEKTRGGITSDCTRCDRGKCPTCHGSGTR